METEELKQSDVELRERMKKIQLQQSREKKERFDPIGAPPDKAAAKAKYEKEEKALKETLDDILGTEKKVPPPKPRAKAAAMPKPAKKREPAEEEEEPKPRSTKKPKLIGDTIKKFSKAAQRKKEAEDENPAPAKPRKPEGLSLIHI